MTISLQTCQTLRKAGLTWEGGGLYYDMQGRVTSAKCGSSYSSTPDQYGMCIATSDIVQYMPIPSDEEIEEWLCIYAGLLH